MLKVITFGSATLDLFLDTEEFGVIESEMFVGGEALCFPFSSKIDIGSLEYSTGGGGTNTAATFSKQGFEVAYCGVVGRDFAGSEVMSDLERFNIQNSFVIEKDECSTNLSLIFSSGGDRTAFVWREASELLIEDEVPWSRLEADWLYLAPLSGELRSLFKPIVRFANEKEIKVFANPGNSQIEMEGFEKIVKGVDVLLLNQKEACLLTGVSFNKEEELFQTLDEMVDGLVIMTKGSKGAVASDGESLWEAPSLSVEAVEKTGAGDSFGSGFLSVLARGGSVEESLQMGIANSASCISKRGAKEGLLGREEEWSKVEVSKRRL